VWSEDDEAARKYKGEIADELQNHELEVSYRRFHGHDTHGMFGLLQTANGSLLVVGVSDQHLSLLVIRKVYEHLEQPLLVVR
jgi:hypothetical protein